jgi:shikimate dehydrogenase
MSAPPKYAVIGDPVEHSLSPRLFGWLFSELRMSGSYARERVPPEKLGELVSRIRQGEWNGVSVTLPHKEAICPMLDELDSNASRIAACNCVLRLDSGRLAGFNTDGAGLRQALQAAGGADLGGARVVLLGAGGAARAAAFEVAFANASELTIANRTVERARRLIEDVRRSLRAPTPALKAIPLEEKALSKALANANVVLNSTRVGLDEPGQDPLPPTCRMRRGQTVLDMVYRPLQTSLLKRAASDGATPVDGLWMLIFQALEQLRLWTGRWPPTDVVQPLHDFLAREVA